MDFFISSAYAQDAAPAGGEFMGLLFPILLLAVFFFLFIRPQQKRMKEHKTMVEALKKGDEVINNGGLAGAVTAVNDAFVTVKVAEGVEVNIQKQAVASLLPKGTLKKL
ncbi:MAG TPA: preprotein translocase subunit YajC [Gammaproteobacteria bacterium]|jgi:preprotein translocase subunit YajC|nr:preprotein translocase subunit YajC [Gammaproteobacteria bacterium]